MIILIKRSIIVLGAVLLLVGFVCNGQAFAASQTEKVDITYQYISSSQTNSEIPDEVLATKPSAHQALKGSTVIPTVPSHTEVKVDTTLWTFKGYAPNKVEHASVAIVFTGTWEPSQAMKPLTPATPVDPQLQPGPAPNLGISSGSNVSPSSKVDDVKTSDKDQKAAAHTKRTSKLPRTGDVQTPILVFAGLALGLVASGFAVRKMKLNF